MKRILKKDLFALCDKNNIVYKKNEKMDSLYKKLESININLRENKNSVKTYCSNDEILKSFNLVTNAKNTDNKQEDNLENKISQNLRFFQYDGNEPDSRFYLLIENISNKLSFKEDGVDLLNPIENPKNNKIYDTWISTCIFHCMKYKYNFILYCEIEIGNEKLLSKFIPSLKHKVKQNILEIKSKDIYNYFMENYPNCDLNF